MQVEDKMKKTVIYATLCLFYLSTDCNEIGWYSNSIGRRKRQDIEDRWIWGEDGTQNSTPATSNKPETENPEDNPCNWKPIQKPDFSAPGRRISEQKCYEYMWNIKFREDQSRISKACIEYTAKHQGPNGPYFAIGGRGALPGEFPHMGAIGWKAAIGTWIFKCGSTLISSKWALTAAHCTKASDRDTDISDVIPKIIRFGDKNIVDVWSNGLPPMDQNITRIILHPNFQSPKKYNDIALMEIENELTFNYNVQPACLWKDFDTSALGTQVTVTGWGVISTAGRESTPNLQVVVLDVVDSKTCDELLRPRCNRLWCGIQNTQICAGKMEGGVDACRGDSGGPLQVKIPLPTSEEGAMHYVIGVTSFGFGCALANTPGVYTRVSPYLDWIESIVWQ